ncbi:hypothetical protein SAY87_021484 [Trapa incisa]|uniref:non-specific serine/threonine protein kinase n=1 Tax=Trapa incisa TaxID=236973 RepID=A0AAN7PRH5_9MYRT|nr:hypothetical protein SAY87_021484 [Trapa incisa]
MKKTEWTISVGVFFCFLSVILRPMDARQLLQQGKTGYDEEVQTLIAFKNSSVSSDPSGLLSGWSPESSTPCSWRGVTCDGPDGRVQALNLSDFGLVGALHLQYLAALSNLRTLYLQGNIFSSRDLRFGPSLLHLDLSRNMISDPAVVSSSLSSCQNLNSLNFSANKINGTLQLASCKSLTVLDLSHNNFSGSFSGVNFTGLRNLTVLDLSHNVLSGTGFPASLGTCQELDVLNLSYNELHGEIPGTLIGSLRSLSKLSLAHNRLSGQIPMELGQSCGSLHELDLSANNLEGELPSSFSLCSSLQSLNLDNNLLAGDFITTVLSSLSGLQYLRLAFNNITGPVPISLTNLTKLRLLDLSSNFFDGEIPSLLCSSGSFSSLEKLLLANNYISGVIPSQLGNCRSLKSIDFSFNHLNGEIPREVWSLPRLIDMVMWANNLTGEIPEGICRTIGGNLEMLILNNNLISGAIPMSISSCTNMIWVSLSSNRLAGEIPPGIGDLPSLAILQLGNNSLTGRIPAELGRCRGLIWLDLNSNNLTGSLPPELADQAGMVVPGSVSGKEFAFVRNEGGTGCRGAGGLVEFEGIRPWRLESYPMVHSCPSTRIYTGLTVYTFASKGSMIYLDLSYNFFSGEIPESYGSMEFLQVLNLGHNRLSGGIPESFGDLKAIGVLDLSHNHLEGYLPASLGALSFLTDLDVSNNNFTGPIPSGGQLTTFPASRYENNTGLCGLPLLPCGSGGGSLRHVGSNAPRGKRPFEAGMVIGISFFVLCIIGLLLALYRVKQNQKFDQGREKYIESLSTSGTSSWKLSSIHEPLSINVAAFEKPLQRLNFGHLVEATNGFSAESLIGSGGFGEVYKAQLRDGHVVAIKKLIHITGQGDREFMAEMETIGKIRHRNLVPLMGYCNIGEERLLVYEYMRWGSLESVLHDRGAKAGGLKPLDWSVRRRIAIGSARGLAFLHHSCIPHIIHRDMKSSNVLLDENLEARVSDFGMARLVNALDTHLSVSTLAGTPGYVPPEYYQSFRCTTKGDVYSYGVILLELLSGRQPIDSTEFGEDNNLVSWAKQLHKEKRVTEILDPELLSGSGGCSGEAAELYHYLRIAFECLDDMPFKRPTMIQVMTMFKELQVDSLESDILDGLSVKDSVFDETREKEI